MPVWVRVASQTKLMVYPKAYAEAPALSDQDYVSPAQVVVKYAYFFRQPAIQDPNLTLVGWLCGDGFVDELPPELSSTGPFYYSRRTGTFLDLAGASQPWGVVHEFASVLVEPAGPVVYWFGSALEVT